MRMKVLMAMVVAGSAMLCAQSALAQGSPAAAARLFASSADVKAMIAKAKAERKADQPNFSQPIVGLAPYSANLEYRVGNLNAPASTHMKDAELFVVIEGSGTAVTGGHLQNERRTNADNASGTGIEGGDSRKIAAGDIVLVPEGTPHWFTQIDGALVLMSLHLPR
ncbi:MAG: cupin domain-containing protein [Vicinamibacterales bacterium]